MRSLPVFHNPEKSGWTRTIEGRLPSGQEGLDVGNQLRVQLVRTDVDRGFIDFKRVE